MNNIETAIKMEREAVDFYTKCAEKTTNPLGKKMFLSIAEDEKNHMTCAIKVTQDQAFKPSEATPFQNIKRIFEQSKESMLQRVASTTDELEALEFSIKMEQDAIDFYKKASAQAKSLEEKDLFDCLIKDEEEHLKIIQNTHSFLSNTGHWFMWEEHSIVEG
jgi:rubrerythrin